jgi:hypothetical protein
VGAAAAGRQCDGEGAGAGVQAAEDVGFGVYKTLEDLARAKGLAPSYVSRILRLTQLEPEIVEAILDGRQPAEMQLDDLLAGFPLEWGRQRKPSAISGPYQPWRLGVLIACYGGRLYGSSLARGCAARVREDTAVAALPTEARH